VLEQISKGIRLKRNTTTTTTTNDEAEDGEKHDAQGRPPFRQLTALGVLQMVQLGKNEKNLFRTMILLILLLIIISYLQKKNHFIQNGSRHVVPISPEP
jgi:cell division protein FtsL